MLSICSQVTSYKTKLLQLFDDESKCYKGNVSLSPSHCNVSSNETSAVAVDNLETECSPDEAVSLTVFTEEISNIWSEIEAIRGKFIQFYQPKESEIESSK